MGETYSVSTWVLNDIESESPGQVAYKPGPSRGSQVVTLEKWQYDVIVNHCERVLYSGGQGVERTLAAARASAYSGTLNRLLAHGDPIEAEHKEEKRKFRYRGAEIQKYPDFDGSQPCASVGPTVMFPEDLAHVRSDGKRHRVDHAYQEKEIAEFVCGGCEFIGDCMTWGLYHEEYGVWGGTTAAQRRRLRKQLDIKVVDPYLVAVYGGE